MEREVRKQRESWNKPRCSAREEPRGTGGERRDPAANGTSGGEFLSARDNDTILHDSSEDALFRVKRELNEKDEPPCVV